jgi:hypothetical protein
MTPEMMTFLLDQAKTCAAERLPEFLGKLETVRVTALARLSAPVVQNRGNDQLLDVMEASKRLKMSKQYLYRNHEQFDFTRRVGRKLLFSAKGIDEFISKQGGH